MVFTDNNHVSTIINTGASRNISSMTLARNIWLASAIANFNISATFDVNSTIDIDNATLIPADIVANVDNVYIDL
jgi:hypothetical protein